MRQQIYQGLFPKVFFNASLSIVSILPTVEYNFLLDWTAYNSFPKLVPTGSYELHISEDFPGHFLIVWKKRHHSLISTLRTSCVMNFWCWSVGVHCVWICVVSLVTRSYLVAIPTLRPRRYGKAEHCYFFSFFLFEPLRPVCGDSNLNSSFAFLLIVSRERSNPRTCPSSWFPSSQPSFSHTSVIEAGYT